MPVPALLRLGCVQYLNARPLIHGWPGEVRFDHPSVLCRQLAAGELDVALVSSFEYLRHPRYTVVDGLAVGSDGPVFSVILAHLGPLEDLREVVVDPASETSVNLLRCLLGARGLPVRFVGAGELSAERGRLLIGDQAIRFREECGAEYQILDLGAAWKERMNSPFVYALWLIDPDYAGKESVAEQLRSLGRKNLENLEAVIASCPEPERAFCGFYFRECLHFAFGDAEKEGFQKFGDLCFAQKLLPSRPPAPRLV
ncbi:MAG: menaquinone biosynthesis protein [Spartobacteria bacterium]